MSPFGSHKIVLRSAAAKKKEATSDQEQVHKCNAIWLSSTFVPLVQMTKQCSHYTVDLLGIQQALLEKRRKASSSVQNHGGGIFPSIRSFCGIKRLGQMQLEIRSVKDD